MPTARRRDPILRRRRRDDEDGESSAAGDIDDLSLSEGSVISNADDDGDAEGSDATVEDEDTPVPTAEPESGAEHVKEVRQDNSGNTNGSTKVPGFKSTFETEVMMTGLRSGSQDDKEEARLDEVNTAAVETPLTQKSSADVLTLQSETPAQRSRREHLEYIKQRNANPAFVPNRGGFFLHDDRGTAHNSSYGRPFPRGRGRGFNGGHGIVGRGHGDSVTEPADRQWAHDLHETVNKSIVTPSIKAIPAGTQIPTARAAAVAPNRSFSMTVVLGNVGVSISMPGMESKKTVVSFVKKQHTLLPQHRPPLRRDKPVRISIPDQHPRYIFPSMERSFIFIPRALRPNQHAYPRTRGGRGNFQGSRRGSIMGGSVYTPSVGMSRRSSISIGPGGNGLPTPTDSGFHDISYSQNIPRPVVRMPMAGYPMPIPNQYPPQWPLTNGSYIPEHGTSGPAILHSPPVAIPMHQPRPQKTVSMAGIESPAFKAPQQQHEQPFHQQVPPGVDLVQTQTQSNSTIGTPLSHIPEGAVYAQPFQPYPMYSQSGYYGVQYPGPQMFFPPTSEAMGYGMPLGGPVMAPQFVPSPQAAPYHAPAVSIETGGQQQSTVAHESNGMVFYYDQSQSTAEGTTQYPSAAASGVMNMPAAPYFYSSMPNAMFYPSTGP